MLRFLTAVFALLGMCFCAQAQQDWDKVVADGKKEGKVVIYNSANGASYFTNVINSFEKKYGIKVESLDLRASELTERIRVEQVAGRYVGDLELHSTSTIEQQIIDGPFVEPIGKVPNIANLRPELPATDMYIPAWIQAYGILVNSRMVKPEDEPKSWTDLLDPKWKDKILSDDTRPLGGGQTMFFVTQKTFGTGFHEKLAAQNLVFDRDMRNDARRVARGEYPIYIPLMFAMASDLKGLPVKVLVMKEGVPYVPINFARLKNSPHPNAALVFINHFLEIDSQVQYANGWMTTVVKGVADKANPDARPFVEPVLLGKVERAERQPMMDLAKKIYSK
ncbi:MAG: ABC transporter substrate-binding protein [Xanthobacteraceae bacterium]